MADTFTPLLRLRLQETGGNENTWGQLLNSDTITPIENAIAGITSYGVTGGAVDLSATPLVHQIHSFSGTLTSDCTVTIPNKAKRAIFANGCTGGFSLLLKTASGAAIEIPAGTQKDVICDGSGNLYRIDKDEVGKVAWFASTSVPSGYLECDGSAVSRAAHPNLFAAISTTYGVGNGSTTFNLPDLKTAGRFIRSRTASVTVGTVQAEMIGPHSHAITDTGHNHAITDTGHGHTNTDSGHAHGVNEGAGHNHSIPFTLLTGIAGGGSGIAIGSLTGGSTTGTNSNTTGLSINAHTADITVNSNTTGITIQNHTTGISINNNSGSENHPVNVSMIACIKY